MRVEQNMRQPGAGAALDPDYIAGNNHTFLHQNDFFITNIILNNHIRTCNHKIVIMLLSVIIDRQVMSF